MMALRPWTHKGTIMTTVNSKKGDAREHLQDIGQHGAITNDRGDGCMVCRLNWQP